MEVEEATLLLTGVIFVIAVGSATIQGIAFWKRYRIRLHVTSKTPSVHSVRDLESAELDLPPQLISPQPVRHPRRQSTTSRRWPSQYYHEHQWDPAYYDRRPGTVVHTYTPFAGDGPIVEELEPTRRGAPTTTAAPAEPRDPQGLSNPKP